MGPYSTTVNHLNPSYTSMQTLQPLAQIKINTGYSVHHFSGTQKCCWIWRVSYLW